MAEQQTLAKYVGWGAFAQDIFREGPKYAEERSELRGLVTRDEWDAMRASTLNAHYTSRTVIEQMWRGLQRLGVPGGQRVLEPSAGVGHFLGLMPDQAYAKQATAIELDPLSGRIAGQLYPNFQVEVAGFEEVRLPDNFYDVAVSNVPFGNYKLADPKYRKLGLNIHNYFIVKSLDKVRPGGVTAMVTSRFTMDSKDAKHRREIAKRADLVGAIRLPNTAFKANAGTEVTTDILFLRKRAQGADQGGAAFENLKEITTRDGQTVQVNEYFADNPGMMVGEMALTRGMYGSNEPALEPAGDLQQGLRQVIDKLPEGVFEEAQQSPQRQVRTLAEIPTKEREREHVIRDGQVYQVENGQLHEAQLSGKQADRVRRLIDLRDLYRETVRAMATGASQATIDDAQARLNKAYDDFRAKHGPINETNVTVNKRGQEQRRQPNLQKFRHDPGAPLVMALEKWDENDEQWLKADLFRENVVLPKAQPSNPKSAKEALLQSLNERGGVDLAWMQDRYGADEQTIRRELSGLIYENPETGQIEQAETYLAGRVRSKLAAAEAAAKADSKYQENVEALKAVQPEDVPFDDMRVSLGAPWVPESDVEEFVGDILGSNNVSVSHSKEAALWKVGVSTRVKMALDNTSKWGTPRKPAHRILEDSLNGRPTKVTDTVVDNNGNEKSITNAEETQKAQAKQKQIEDEFKAWLERDTARRERLQRLYNDTYNDMRLPKFDGSHLELPTANANWDWRQHQKDAIWRILSSGNTLLGHVVGAGKTAVMVASGMEMRRLGLAKKPMYVVPNHMLEQFSREFLHLYPTANILQATKDDFSGPRRRQFTARIASEDWDAVIMTQSSFERVPVSAQHHNKLIQGEVDKLTQSINEMKQQEGEKGRTVKQLEKMKKSLQAKLRDASAPEKKDDALTFDELGVDQVFVDEAHYAKRLAFATKMGNINGVDQAHSQRAWDLYTKTQLLHQRTPGHGTVFATGTPVTNTMAELYHMQRFLQPQELEDRGLDHFDAWAKQFGEVVTSVETTPEGKGFRQNRRFAKFINVAELLQIFRQVADVQRTQDLNLPTPPLKGGQREQIAVPASQQLKDLVDQLANRAEEVRQGNVDKDQDNMLKITYEGRHAALDLRALDPEKYDEPKPSKAEYVADKVAQLYKKHAATRSTQLLFSDISTPTHSGWNIYQEIADKLVERGVSREDIAFVHDANTDEKKKRLFEKVRNGDVRILMGSTDKMGMGTNVQDRLVALHHLDVPWRPADIEQREGRILRQGNKVHKEDGVEINFFTTQGSFEAYMWDTQESKARFIDQLWTDNLSIREIEDPSDRALSAAEMKAIASGDERVKRKIKLDAQFQQLSAERASYREKIARLRRREARLPQEIEAEQRRVQNLEADQKRVRDLSGDSFRMSVEGTTYTDRKKAANALAKTAVQAWKAQRKAPSGEGRTIDVGEISGFTLKINVQQGVNQIDAFLEGQGTYRIDLGNAQAEWGIGNVRRVENQVAGIPKQLDEAREAVQEMQNELEQIRQDLQKPFEKEDRYQEVVDELTKLEEELGITEDEAAADTSTDGDKYSLAELENQLREQTAKNEELRLRLERIVQRMTGGRAKLQLRDRKMVVRDQSGKRFQVAGRFIPANSPQNGDISPIIEAALRRDGRTEHIVRHEVIHAIRSAGLIREQEWKVLSNRAQRWRKQYSVDAQYGHLGLTEDELVEEAVARAFENRDADQQSGLVGRVFRRIRNLLERFQNALNGLGFYTPDDIFERIETGDVGARADEAMDYYNQAVTPGEYRGFLQRTLNFNSAAADRAMKYAREDLAYIREHMPEGEDTGKIHVEENLFGERDVGLIERWIAKPQHIFRRYPRIQRVIQRGQELEMDMSRFQRRFNEQWAEVRAQLNSTQFADLSDLLFQGDADQRVYTNAELREAGYDDTTINAYREARKLIERMGRYVDQHRRSMLPRYRQHKQRKLHDAAKKRGMDVSEFRQLMVKRTRLRNKLRRGDGDPEALDAKLGEINDELWKGNTQNEEFDEIIGEIDRMDAMLAQTSVRKREGYVPHKFFGTWRISRYDGADDEGNPIWSLVASKDGFFPNRADAVAAAQSYLKNNPGAQLRVHPVETKFPYQAGTQLSDSSYEALRSRLMENLGLEGEELQQAMQGVARKPSRRRIPGFARYRAGVQGYADDINQVLQAHIMETVRYVTMDKLKHLAINTMEAEGIGFEQNPPDTRKQLQKAFQAWYRDVAGMTQPSEANLDQFFLRMQNHAVFGTPLRTAMVTGGTSAFLAGMATGGAPFITTALASYAGYRFYKMHKEGGTRPTRQLFSSIKSDMAHVSLGAFTNVASALTNLSQTVLNTYPVLGSKYTMEGIRRLERARNKNSKEAHLLDRADVDTRFKFTEANDQLLQKEGMIEHASLFLFNKAEVVNRGVAFLGAYAKAEDEGASPAEAFRQARDTMLRTQFHYGPAAKPEALRNVIGSVPLQFQNFLIQQTAFVVGLWRDARQGHPGGLLRFGAAMILLGGTLGIPGVELLDWLFEMLTGTSVMKEFLAWNLQLQAEGGLPGTISSFLLRGAPSIMGPYSLTLTNRVGMGKNFFPMSLRDFKGPFIDTIDTAVTLGRQNAGLIDIASRLMPGIGSPLKAVQSYYTGVWTNPWLRGYPEYSPSTYQRIMHGMGFTPLESAQLRDFVTVKQYRTGQAQRRERPYERKIIAAVNEYSDNPGRMQARVMEIVREARADDVHLTRQQVMNLVRNARTPRAERALERAPQELQPNMQKLLEGARQ